VLSAGQRREREGGREGEREREGQTQSNYTGSSYNPGVVQSSCISNGFSL